ncbi:hypothetical protein ND861_15510 [Leptospira sp. 2 VSF19]|uniref:DUF4476 domain-containing protein n=1 Tax=Leptospira soteropolitanensis TaxID=2950025 RepID=A0AAW5VGJ9_9LEPT|nr:hypothetical protein [Leptospira soteropolitanensis]MCW7494054.1 hypothetical protein [Leptospira soteropolitanensis]MCW7501680.1 hypothetical protein [Leptospira soteropolitanensis]MCW7523900.1 hypothetical protein [Leptospira soteropolitanensis]MCW7527765.1 hypothetical protein [Leptospira soteropolitanensis]MCW7531650.1 hypothetical protein [Leptospira soteropolitanensis]
MKLNLKRVFIIFGLLSFSIGAQDGTKLIAWKPIPDASGYQIQIKEKTGKIVIDKKIDTPYQSIEDLPSGVYLVRTAPLNLFKKPAVWSAWKDLEVILSEPPKVVTEEEKPIILPKSESKTEKTIANVTIEGEHFLDATKVDLTKKNVALPILSKEVKSSERIDLKVDTTDAKSGPYDLTVTNPYQKPKVVTNFVKVEEPKHSEDDDSKKSKISVPKGKPFRDYSYEEMLAFLETDVAVNCKNTKVPALTLSECHKTYVILNFTSEDNQSVFEFYKLINENESDRISAYQYFAKNCSPKFRPAFERMELQLKNQRNLDPEEKQTLTQELAKFRNCTR